MGTYPWGPHGPQVPANTVTPNPTGYSPAPAFEQSSYAAPSGYAAGGTTAGGTGGWLGYIIGNFIFSWFFIACTWQFFVCLYPLSAFAAIATGYLTIPVYARMLPPDGKDVALLLGVISGAIVLGVLTRIEYRLARNTGFRLTRHAIRLALLSVLIIPIIMLGTTSVTTNGTAGFFTTVLNHPAVMLRFLTNPVNLGVWAAIMVAIHFLLWNWKWGRSFWHRRLVWLGLK